MKPTNLTARIWRILYPLLLYYAILLSILSVAQLAIGSKPSQYVACQLIASLVTISFMLPLYRQDVFLRGDATLKTYLLEHKKDGIRQALGTILTIACISIACNNLISMSPLITSAAYQEANANFYGSTLLLELISSAIITPFLEELTFRGILFGRLKELLPNQFFAILLSSLLFALMHFNIVQFIYAFILGMALALLMEKAGHIYPAIIGHMTANAIAVIRTETGWLSHTVDKSAFAWTISIVLLGVGILLLPGFCCSHKQSDTNA